MDSATVTITLNRDDLAFLHRKVAAEALMLCGRALNATPAETRERQRLVDLAEALARAQDADQPEQGK